VIPDQYQNTVFELVDGRVLVGRVVRKAAGRLGIQTDPFGEELVEVDRDQVSASKVSDTSPMPEGLLDVLDLFAYLESGGDPSHSIYK
jgi:hypothetical protein